MAGEAGFGSKFYIMSGTSSTAVAGITKISGPKYKGDDIDISDMDSASGFREFVPGLVDAGEVDLDLNYTKAQTSLLNAQWRTTASYKIIYPDSSNFSFTGFMTGLEPESQDDDKISSKATFKISGVPTFATN